MKKYFTWSNSLILVFSILLSYGFSSPRKQAKEGKYHALLIAIDNYTGNTWTSLKNPVGDAKAISSLLQIKYGFENMTTLYNEKATRVNIIETLDRITKTLGENDNLLIYYTGHGINIADEGYWVPASARTKERHELIPVSEIKNALTKTQTKHVLLMVDACFSAAVLKGNSYHISNDGTEDYYNRVGSLLSRQALTAGGLEPVPDGRGDHSVFSKYIIKFLDKNEKPQLDANELYDMIKYPVEANTPNRPQFGHIQNTGHEGGQFIFTLKKMDICNSTVDIQEGQSVKFSKDGGVLHAIASEKNVTYEWTHGSDILNHTGSSLKVKKAGVYGVVAITEDGKCSDAALIDVKIVLPEISLDILEGSSVDFTYKGTLNAKLTGYEGDVIYEWKKGNFLVSKKTTLEVKESGDYTLTVKLQDGRVLGIATTKVQVKERVYTSQLGDNVRRIAKRFYGDSDKANLIYKANTNITPDNVLRVGTKLIIPSDVEKTKKAVAITLAANKTYSPFSNPDSYKGGILTDIIKTVYSEMEKEVEVTYLEGFKVKGATYNGRANLGYPFLKNKPDAMLFLYSKPLYSTLNVFFVKKGSEIIDVQKTMKKRMKKGKYKKLLVGVLLGTNSDKLIEMAGRKLIGLKAFKSVEECFLALEEGRVDMVAVSQVAGLVTLRNDYRLNASDFRMLDKVIETNTLHMVISREHPEAKAIMKEFNQTFLKLKASGKIAAIADTHVDLIQKGKP